MIKNLFRFMPSNLMKLRNVSFLFKKRKLEYMRGHSKAKNQFWI